MTIDLVNVIKQNYEQVVDRIHRAAEGKGRDPESIRLLVVTKGHSLEVARAAVSAGAQYLGENYVEEAVSKIQALIGEAVEWHMIGHVQSRKARPVCEYFAWVHSIDRLIIARYLNDFVGQVNRHLPVLLECNVSGDASK